MNGIWRTICITVCAIAFAIFLFTCQEGVANTSSSILHWGRIESMSWSVDGGLALQELRGILIYEPNLETYSFIQARSYYESGSMGDPLIISRGISWNSEGEFLAIPYFHNLPTEPTGIRVKLLSLIENEEIGFWPSLGGYRRIQDIEWGSDERLAFIGQSQLGYNECTCYSINVWNTEGQPIGNGNSLGIGFEWTENLISDIEWSPDGNTIAAAYTTGLITLWNSDTGEEVKTFQAHEAGINAIRWNSATNLLASAGNDTLINIWNIDQQEPLQVLENNNIRVNAVDWNLDGSFLAGGGNDGKLRIWNVQTGALISTLEGHTDSIYAVEWNLDGDKIATASSDNTVRIWDVSDLPSSQ